jgi:hypothetical protein
MHELANMHALFAPLHSARSGWPSMLHTASTHHTHEHTSVM